MLPAWSCSVCACAMKGNDGAITIPTGRHAPTRAPRLVVLRALGLGDLLTAVPALHALRRALPGHRLQLATPAALAPLVHLIGGVDDVVDVAPLAPLPAALAQPDLAVNLHGRGPQSSLLLAALDPRRLWAFHHAEVPATSGGPTWERDEHEVARWCRMIGHHGVPADPTELALAPPPLDAVAALRGATVIHPGASGPARRWPPERWADVARAEVGAGREVLVTGSAAELPLAMRVAEAADLPRSAVLAGATGLDTLAAVVAVAGRVLCGDTGVAHLASALGTPSVVLFGPVPPSQWGPPPGPHLALWKGQVGDGNADRPHEGLLAITSDEVLAALADLPEGTVHA